MGLCALTLLSVPPSAAGEVRGSGAAVSAEALTREQAVEQALAANPTLKAFGRELEAARARRLQADGFDPPTFFWDFEEAERLGSPSRFGNQVLGVEQSIEWFGVRRARKEAATFGVDAAEALLERARSRIAARTHKAFDEVLQARAAGELLERMTTLAGEAVELARARFRSGTASYVDFLRLRLRREQLQNERRTVLVAETAARRELNGLLGRSGEAITLQGELTETAPLPEVSPYLADAEQKAPTLRLLEYRRAEAAKRYEAARGGRLPEFTLGLGRERLYDGAADYAWAGRLGLRLPLPGSDRQQGREAEALAELNRTAELGRAQRLAVQTRLGQRLDEAAVLAQRVEDYRKVLLPDAADQLKAAQQDYRVGRIDALGLIDVFNTYVEIQRDYLETLARLRAAAADLAGFGEDLWEVEL
ncbi:hypothetical protein SVA_3147 [Sulfurifustis variabilis]|uniref:Transporter n=1 Tax=Sulfurifustis variabilis TaxID=1675686 RepID=A0A1C7AEU6_9GAMM|nr:hypothetical protein SVA_3147 [Sulfurifustis variabilis]